MRRSRAERTAVDAARLKTAFVTSACAPNPTRRSLTRAARILWRVEEERSFRFAFELAGMDDLVARAAHVCVRQVHARLVFKNKDYDGFIFCRGGEAVCDFDVQAVWNIHEEVSAINYLDLV